ncbi:GGDEF domain-containing protein [Acinetobacter baumannii]
MPYSLREFSFSTSLKFFLLFTIIITLCCVIGIASRPLSFLAFFWPANSVFLGLLLRFPQTRQIGSFAGAFTGYMIADLVNGTPLFLTLILTISNYLYVVTTLALAILFNRHIKAAYQGYSYLLLFALCGIGSITGAFFAATFVPMFNTKFMIGSFWAEFGYWVTSELQNALLLLPIILNIPPYLKIKNHLKGNRIYIKAIDFLPLFAVLISIGVSYYDSGPGSLLYPIAALIWCAIRYKPIIVALITSFTSAYIIYHVSGHYLLLYPQDYLGNTISIRIGLIMMTVAPLTVSSISALHSELIQKLQHAIAHDELTSSLTRRQFLQSVRLLQEKVQKENKTSAFFMLDVDHFKKVNDSYGHLIGDRALQTCVTTIQNILHPHDLLGRFGGEEFAIFIPDTTREAAFELAERIRIQISQQPIYVYGKLPIFVQVSIGISLYSPSYHRSIESLFKEADDALYQAKRQGRNRVFISL